MSHHTWNDQRALRAAGYRDTHHLVCRGCGAEREVLHEVTDAFYGLVEERFGFRVTSDHVVLEGLCEAWARAFGTNAAITHRR